MFEEINKQLAEWKTKLRHKNNKELRLKQLNEELTAHQQKVNLLYQKWQQEQRDVDRLTGLTLGSLFFSLIGRKAEKLSKEEQEVLQAKFEYEEAVETVKDLESEIDEVQSYLKEVGFVESEIARLMESKRQKIHWHYPSLSQELQNLTDQEIEYQAKLKELQEALTAGQAVLSSLHQAKDQMNSARNWGAWDMLGGGMISTHIKHNRIDDARSTLHNAQRHLRRFQQELQDVQMDAALRIEVGNFLTFADYFFDGFISDWLVQGKINRALSEINDKLATVSKVIQSLQAELRKTEALIQSVRTRISSMIETA